MGRIPILKVGDVVEPNYKYYVLDKSEKYRSIKGSSGVVFELGGLDCLIYWYSGVCYSHGIQQLKRCGGVKRKKFCNECEQNNVCSHLQEIARCRFSEFGQWRAKGKTKGMPLDAKACNKCDHRSLCWGHRFIQCVGD